METNNPVSTQPNQPAQSAQSTQPSANIVQQSASGGGSNKMMLWLIVALVVIILAVGGIYFYFSKNQTATPITVVPTAAPQAQENLENDLKTVNVDENVDTEFSSIDQAISSL